MSKKINCRERIMDLFLRMLNGETINYKEAMEEYGVSLEPIQIDFRYMKRRTNDHIPELEFYYDYTLKKHGIRNNGKISFETVITMLTVMVEIKVLTESEIKEVADNLSLFIADDKKSDLKKILNKLLHDNNLPVKNENLSKKVGILCDHCLDKKVINFTYREKNTTTVKEYEGVSYTVYFNKEDKHFYVVMYLIDEGKGRLFCVENIQKITVKKHSFTISATVKKDLDKLKNNKSQHD